MALKAGILVAFFLLPLLSVKGLVDSDPNRRSFKWKVLTKRNFSSQIRTNPHIILIISVPWCGESRTLMREIAHEAAVKQEKFGHLRLMVIYRNDDKILADVLGATEGITIFFYYHSVAYRYRGRLRTENIFTSLNHLMSLQPDELPLKTLSNVKDLNTFLQSTDKAVLLLEFCGWTPRLLDNNKESEKQSAFHVQDVLDNDGQGENLSSGVQQTFQFGMKENQKGLKIQELTCGVKSELSGSLLGAFNWENETSPLLEDGDGGADDKMSCTLEEFQQFESFLSKFTTVAREYLLPPERQRFGLVSKRFLLSFLGVESLDRWSLMLHFTGCPNCSKILNRREDIKSAMLMNHKLVPEIEGKGDNLEPALPGNKPSIILFVDRSSKSSKIRKKSKLALEIFRNLSLSCQPVEEQNSITGERISTQTLSTLTSKIISDQSGFLARKLSSAQKVVKFKDKMAYMIINEGGKIALDDIAADGKGNTAQGILDLLLQQTNPSSQMKQAKISILAKEAGFQLLSDDFEVKILDELPPPIADDRPEKDLGNKLTDQEISELPINSEVENDIDLNRGNSLDATADAVSGNGKQPELVDAETSIEQQEDTPYYKDNLQFFHAESAEEAKKVKIDIVESVSIDENDYRSNKVDVELSTNSSEQSLHLDQMSHSVGSPSLKEQGPNDLVPLADYVSNSVNSNGAMDNLVHDRLESGVVGNVIAKETQSMMTSDKVKEHQVHSQTFKGSFFFSDGGYRLLGSLTAASKIPTVVILDPGSQHHYVFPEDKVFSYSSLVRFVDEFLNGSLPSYQRVQSARVSPRETPQPPFVNLDFREADSIPQVTLDTFSELVLGFNRCERGYALSCFNNQNIGPPWMKDVLVLFSNSWCGFCQRMELVVREVYRAFKSYKNVLKSNSSIRGSTPIQDNSEDTMSNESPSIFLMDCTLNDCRTLLELMDQEEVYPALMLFPAEKKRAIPYQGQMSVSNVIEFIAALGSKSRHLSGNKGILWAGVQRAYWSTGPLQETYPDPDLEQVPVNEGQYHEVLLNTTAKQVDKPHDGRLHTSINSNEEDQHIGVGSVLIATDRLLDAPPFDNSTILIVKADREEGFQGLITNKRIKWDILQGLDEERVSLREAPLFFGGPVIVPGMPLVSFARKDTGIGHLEVVPSFFFGDQMATFRAIEGIKTRNLSAIDYWFFLGYSKWGWNQLFSELAEGAWRTSNYQIEQLAWPEN